MCDFSHPLIVVPVFLNSYVLLKVSTIPCVYDDPWSSLLQALQDLQHLAFGCVFSIGRPPKLHQMIGLRKGDVQLFDVSCVYLFLAGFVRRALFHEEPLKQVSHPKLVGETL